VLRPSSFRSVFAATRHRDFRLFIIGQFVSLCGTWIQTVAQGWLVLQLTNSALAVGLVTTMGSLPILLFTLYGGVVADRVNKRRLVLLLQSLMLTEALILAILTQLHLITVHWVMGLAMFSGLLSAFEVPTRQSMIAEIVAREDLMNAIALGSSAFNVARVVGPSIAGALIATVGLAACFFVNAVSFLAVIVSLILMRVTTPAEPSKAATLGALKEGFRYIFGNPLPRAIIILIATLSIFGVSFMPMMPVFARDVLHLDATGYGLLVSAVGIGAAAAAIFMAGVGGRTPGARLALRSSLVFGVVVTAAGLAPEFWTAVVLFTLSGCTMALNGIAANTTLQTEAPDYLRGRVMGFYSFVVLGMAPFGSLQAGWVSEHFGVRVALALGGGICFLVAAIVGWERRPKAQAADGKAADGKAADDRTAEGKAADGEAADAPEAADQVH
jgi:MFS family permease